MVTAGSSLMQKTERLQVPILHSSRSWITALYFLSPSDCHAIWIQTKAHQSTPNHRTRSGNPLLGEDEKCYGTCTFSIFQPHASHSTRLLFEYAAAALSVIFFMPATPRAAGFTPCCTGLVFQILALRKWTFAPSLRTRSFEEPWTECMSKAAEGCQYLKHEWRITDSFYILSVSARFNFFSLLHTARLASDIVLVIYNEKRNAFVQ